MVEKTMVERGTAKAPISTVFPLDYPTHAIVPERLRAILQQA